ncbi:DUF1207 domain-containing protein [Marinicella sp. X102]|nr:DUF1207 domain-containing protein [Marinicella marina]
MKSTTLILLTLFMANKPFASQASELKNQLNACKMISNSTQRLKCYDEIVNAPPEALQQSAKDTPQQQATNATIKNEFPILIADINEPNLMLSLGRLDLLGRDFKAALISAGKRHLIRNIALPNGETFALNVIGQIRSQFDVDEIDTRNNRGGALINTDFIIGGEVVKSMEDWSWRFSYTHKSTHLGDEFLIDNPEFLENRINLSYETIRWDAAKSFNHWDWYAGLGFITRSEPGDLEKFMWQAGWQYVGDHWHNIKPIWAVDLSSWGAYDWNINATMRAGIEIRNFTHTPFQLMFEYQEGQSPYGQFFTDDFSYSGITLLKHW